MPITIPNSTPETHVAICIDSSGSMQSLSRAAVETFNSIVTDLKSKAKELDQDVKLSLYTFGDEVSKALFVAQPIDKVKALRQQDFVASGGTPLFDCLGTAIADLKHRDGSDVANLVTVITDGEENTSKTQNATTIKTQIDALQRTDRYTFTFLVPPGGEHVLTRLGIPSGNVQGWETTEKGMKVAAAQASTGYGAYLQQRSVGVTASNGFFLAKVDPVKAAAAKANLKDVQGDFKTFKVRKDVAIADFVFEKNLEFRVGSGFYQLTKKETVQSTKEVLLREKATGKIYGGADARGILGFPVGTDIKAVPGGDEWDIFVQSTSNNRKLIGGTEFLYLK